MAKSEKETFRMEKLKKIKTDALQIKFSIWFK